MKQVEVFFDYICPYCLRAHEILEVLRPRMEDVELIWHPCESHPRPDAYRPHSDLLIEGMFLAQSQGVDLWEYHRRAYRAALIDKVNVEDIEVLTQVFYGLLDSATLAEVLRNGLYQNKLQQSNEYAFIQSGVWAVPSFRTNGQKLDAIEGIGVASDLLKKFILGTG